MEQRKRRRSTTQLKVFYRSLVCWLTRESFSWTTVTNQGYSYSDYMLPITFIMVGKLTSLMVLPQTDDIYMHDNLIRKVKVS